MAPRYTTQLNRRAGSATVSAHKDGDAYKLMNRTQAENHARKVGGEVYKPAISRVYYVKVKPALTKWPGADSRRKARPAPAPPHGAEYSYDTYPDGKKTPGSPETHAWVESRLNPTSMTIWTSATQYISIHICPVIHLPTRTPIATSDGSITGSASRHLSKHITMSLTPVLALATSSVREWFSPATM